MALVVLLGIGWSFRAEIALFGIHRMAQLDVGPTQEINWFSGYRLRGGCAG